MEIQLKCEWRICESFPEYEVSNLGNVRNVSTKKELKGVNRLYNEVCLRSKGKQVSAYTHRLVAEAFIPNPENLPQVNHIDGNKLNNAVTNLEWCTAKHNIQHAWKTGLSTTSHKSRNAGDLGTNKKLSSADVKYIREHYVRGTNQYNKGNSAELCEMFGITESNLSHIITGRNWGCL